MKCPGIPYRTNTAREADLELRIVMTLTLRYCQRHSKFIKSVMTYVLMSLTFKEGMCSWSLALQLDCSDREQQNLNTCSSTLRRLSSDGKRVCANEIPSNGSIELTC